MKRDPASTNRQGPLPISEAEYVLVLGYVKKGRSWTASCGMVGVSPQRLKNQVRSNEDWQNMLLRAHAFAVDKVEDAAFAAATTTDKHGKFDTKAQQFWLTQRAPTEWQQKPESSVLEDLAAANRALAATLSPEAHDELRKLAAREVLRISPGGLPVDDSEGEEEHVL